jgi:hypothetical protein
MSDSDCPPAAKHKRGRTTPPVRNWCIASLKYACCDAAMSVVGHSRLSSSLSIPTSLRFRTTRKLAMGQILTHAQQDRVLFDTSVRFELDVGAPDSSDAHCFNLRRKLSTLGRHKGSPVKTREWPLTTSGTGGVCTKVASLPPDLNESNHRFGASAPQNKSFSA